MDDAREGSGDLLDGSSQMTFLDRISDMVTVSDRDGRIVYANAATECVTGYAPQTFKKRHPFESIHPDDLARCEEVIARLVETPGLSERIEHRIIHADGSWRWVEVTLESLFEDPAVRGILATVRDITERRRFREVLRESESKYRALFDSIDEGFCIIEVIFDESVDYVFLEVNEAFERQTGLTDVIGKRMREISPDHEEYWYEIFGGVARTGVSERFEREARALGHYYEVYAFPFGDPEDHQLGVLFRDISERREAAEAQSRIAELDAFRVELNDALRLLDDPARIKSVANRMLGEHLAADRVVYEEHVRRDGRDYWLVENIYHVPAYPLAEGLHPVESFGRDSYLVLEGETAIVNDVATDEGISPEVREVFRSLDIAAYVALPVVKDGNPIALFTLNQAAPRVWRPEELALLKETAERTWAAVERARAREALAASEEKYRTLFDSIDEGVGTIELIFDEDERVVDYVYLEQNPAFERLTGLSSDVIGERISEVVPDLESFWFETFERVAKTGEPERFEHQVAALDRWFEVYVSRIGGEGSHKVVYVYNDVTERRHREANDAFLDEVSQELARLANIEETMNALGAKIADYLDLSLCLFVEVDEAEENVAVDHGWQRADVPRISGTYRIRDFVEPEFERILRSGETVVVRNASTDPLVNAEMFAALNVGSMIAVPLVREGKWRFWLGAYRPEVYDWREDEIELMREITARIWTRLERERAEAALRESEAWQAFMLELSDTLRPLGNATDIEREATRMLGEALETNRVFYATVEADGDTGDIRSDYTNGIPSGVGRYSISAFASGFVPDWLAGLTTTTSDVNEDPRFSDEERAAYASVSSRAAVGVPLIKDGRLVALVGVNHSTPREWTDRELALISEVSSRIWEASERARAERALRLSHTEIERLAQQFDVTLSTIEDKVFSFDREGRILYANRNLTDLWGLEPGEEVGKALDELNYPTELIETLIGYVRQVFETGESVHDEAPYTSPTGTVGYYDYIMSPAFGPDGEVEYVVGSARDISDRRHTEEVVQASEEQLRTLVEQSPLAIHIFTPDGASLRSNQAWRTLWNPDTGDPTEENIFDDERITATGLVPYLRRGARGEAVVTEPMFYDPASIGLEGGRKWFRAFVYPVQNGNNGGGVLQVVLMLQDATDSKLRAEERSRALVRDAAMRAEKLERERISRELHDRVAHSMGVAHQSLELYKALVRVDPERAQRRLDLASRITRDVLNQTRNLAIELRRSVADEVENGLRPALENMLNTLVPDDIHSRLLFAGDEPIVPSEASAQVYLVLREAVNNACRHSKCTNLEVRVDVDHEAGSVRGSVTDDGEGFDYDTLIANENSGIGLRAMRERTELVGGDIEVRSRAGDGTTLIVEIPLSGQPSQTSP